MLRQGNFALGIHAVALAVSVAVSWTLAGLVGLAGAAAGSVVATLLDRVVSLRRISAQVGIPVRQLQDWRGIALALGYAVATAALIRIGVDLLVPGGTLSRARPGRLRARARLPADRMALEEPMRLLFITGSLTHGGAERHTITLINRLAQRGHECHAAYVQDNATPARAPGKRVKHRMPARPEVSGFQGH